MTDKLTPPENRTERDQGWRAVDRVKEAGGCGACCNRDRTVLAWGRGVCGLRPELTFPKCVGQEPGFKPDHAVLYGEAVE